MARKYRNWYPGAVYHVNARGNRKGAIFFDKNDYLKYLNILEEVRKKYPFILHSYCLMTNHIHLQIETTTYDIQYIMKDLHSTYAVYFNKKHEFVGHLFQGRYGAKPIDNIAYFLDVSRYIHLNPYEANLVIHPQDYPWSSIRTYVSSEQNPLVDPSKTFSLFPQPHSQNYSNFIASKKEVKEFFNQEFGEESLIKTFFENKYSHYFKKEK